MSIATNGSSVLQIPLINTEITIQLDKSQTYIRLVYVVFLIPKPKEIQILL